MPLAGRASSFADLEVIAVTRYPLHSLSVIVGLAVAGLATAAPKIDRISVSAQPATAGVPVRITVDAIDVDETVCAVQMDFGDGVIDEPQKTGGRFKAFPRTWEHTYSFPGRYTLTASGSRAGNVFGCIATARFDLDVEPAPPPVMLPPPTYERQPAIVDAPPAECPLDWVRKGRVGKNGTFTCVPEKGVKNPMKPAVALDCPPGTSYFIKGRSLGCEKS